MDEVLDDAETIRKLERELAEMKRQAIHDALQAARLAACLHEAREQGHAWYKERNELRDQIKLSRDG